VSCHSLLTPAFCARLYFGNNVDLRLVLFFRGYGFVLYVSFPFPRLFADTVLFTCSDRCPRFESIDSAEKCIETLRKYRNLHPSFSKIHVFLLRSSFLSPASLPFSKTRKIPGTSYGSLSTNLHSQSSLSSFSEGDFEDEGVDSFKARMEKLKDEASTNLYVEG
jgi:hypothetical protein